MENQTKETKALRERRLFRGEFRKICELNSARVERGLRFGRSEHFKFAHARGAEAGADAVEVGVVVTGMADEFPAAFRDASGNRLKQRKVESAGRDDAEAAFGRDHACLGDGAAKGVIPAA